MFKGLKKSWQSFNVQSDKDFGGAGTLKKIIKKWNSIGIKNENHAKKSLEKHLKKNLKDKITKEYGIGRIRGDIAIGKDIIIEMKYRFDSTGKFQRLVGQIEDYKRKFKQVIVVIVGKSDDNLVKDIKKKYKPGVFSTKVHIIKK